MPPRTPTAPRALRWPTPYITRQQLLATGVASRATLARAAMAGALVPIGRRDGTGPLAYRVADVEQWLTNSSAGKRGRRRPAAKVAADCRDRFALRLGGVASPLVDIVAEGRGLRVGGLAVIAIALVAALAIVVVPS